jgi:hypothetical protein
MTRADQESDCKPSCRQFPYDATGLQGKPMRLMGELPTGDAGPVAPRKLSSAPAAPQGRVLQNIFFPPAQANRTA